VVVTRYTMKITHSITQISNFYKYMIVFYDQICIVWHVYICRQFQPKMKQIVIDFECIDGKKMSPHDSPLRPLQQSSATNI